MLTDSILLSLKPFDKTKKVKRSERRMAEGKMEMKKDRKVPRDRAGKTETGNKKASWRRVACQLA